MKYSGTQSVNNDLITCLCRCIAYESYYDSPLVTTMYTYGRGNIEVFWTLVTRQIFWCNSLLVTAVYMYGLTEGI